MDLRATIEYYEGVIASLTESLGKIKKELKDAESKKRKFLKLEEKAKQIYK